MIDEGDSLKALEAALTGESKGETCAESDPENTMAMPSASSSGLRPGSIIDNRYEVVSELGHGGMGAVFEVLDHSLNKETVALKLLYPHHVQDEITFARFRNEVTVARKLSHPNIVRIYDFGEDGNGAVYLTMEYVEGKSLSQYIYAPRHERLAFAEVLTLLEGVIEGMESAHKAGVIHRDLKPDNILISKNGEVKITDFGLARCLGDNNGFTKSGEAVGTPFYMSPEQIRGADTDTRADIYALGIIAYEVACGQRPFQDDQYLQLAAMHLKAPMPSACEVNPGIPAWYDEFVQICGEKNPGDRFQSMTEAKEFFLENKEEIRAASISRPAMSLAATQGKARKYRGRDRGRKSRKKLKSLATTIALALSLAGIAMLLRSNDTINKAAVASLLNAESSMGKEFPFFKPFLKTDLALTQDNLNKAIAEGDLRNTEILLRAGLSPNFKTESGDNLLFQTLSYGDADVARLLLHYGAEAGEGDSHGVTPLMLAVGNNDPELVRDVIRRGVDVNAVDNSGETALFGAVQAGNLQMVKDLVTAGANGKAKDKSGQSAMFYAVEAGHLAIVSLFLENGFEVDPVNKNRMTPLMVAAKAGHDDIVKKLVLSGADQNKRDVRRRTASSFASKDTKRVLNDALKERKAAKEKKIAFVKENGKITSAKKVEGKRKAVVAKAVAGKPAAKKRKKKKPGKTTLRAQGKPKGLFRFGKGVQFEHVQYTLQNVGEETAENIKVSVKIPGGRWINLTGPKSLKRKKKATWAWAGKLDVTKHYHRTQKKLVPSVKCKNCR